MTALQRTRCTDWDRDEYATLTDCLLGKRAIRSGQRDRRVPSTAAGHDANGRRQPLPVKPESHNGDLTLPEPKSLLLSPPSMFPAVVTTPAVTAPGRHCPHRYCKKPTDLGNEQTYRAGRHPPPPPRKNQHFAVVIPDSVLPP